MRSLLSVMLQLRAEAALPGEAVGGAPEVRHQGRERARDRASGEVSCAVIISTFPLLLAEAICVYLVDVSCLFVFFCCLNGKLSVVALMRPVKMSLGFWGFHYPILVVRAIAIAIAYVHCQQ